MARCNGYSHMKTLALQREEWKFIFSLWQGLAFRKEEYYHTLVLLEFILEL